MPKTSSAEALLALFAGSTRAAAILGDLTEMAATRGRLWFWTAYARTLAILSWRIVAAVVVAMSLYQLLGNTLFNAPMRTAPSGPHLPMTSGPHLPILLIFWFEPRFLWFVLPFAVLLYGLRDRFVRLTAIAALGTTIAFLFLPPFSFAGVVIALALIALALLFSGWWKPATVLAATVAFAFWCGNAAGHLSTFLRSHDYIPAYGHGIAGLEPMLASRGSMLASAYLCARLHRWLLQTPNPIAPAQLAGGTNA
jgi:hypothetical protein